MINKDISNSNSGINTNSSKQLDYLKVIIKFIYQGS